MSVGMCAGATQLTRIAVLGHVDRDAPGQVDDRGLAAR